MGLHTKTPLVLLIIALAALCMEGVMGFKEFNVGGALGWHVPSANDTDAYDHWAAKKRFHVGDSLRFQYQNDSVLVVEKFGYYHCDISKPISSFNDGNTVVKLEQPGLIYFISGSIENCRNGQRMIIDIMSPHPHPTAVPPASGEHGESPAEAPAHTKNGGSQLVPMAIVSAFLCLVVAAVMVFH